MLHARVVAIAACLGGGCFVSQPKIEILDDGGAQNVSDAGSDGDLDASPAATLTSPQRSCAAGVCWWSKTAGACMSAGAPQSRDRPDIENAANELPGIYLGFSEISLAGPLHGARDTSAWRSLGFDLDQSCTESPSCETSDRGSCRTQRGSAVDGNQCRDNTLGRLYTMIREPDAATSAPGWDESRINCELRRGGATFILRITGYSGEADDPQVRVDYYQSDGVELAKPWRCGSGDEKDKYPIWLSSQPFGIDAASLTSGIEREGTLPDAFLFDESAYVRGGYLVTEFPQDSDLRLFGEAPFALSVSRGTLAAQLTRGQDGLWKLHDGVFGGRLRVEPLLRSIRESGLCESDARYAPLEDTIRNDLDVLASGERAPGRDCDALSFALGFEASTLTPGAAHTIADPTECGGSETERCGDGNVTGSETCDTAISNDRPGACPTSCPALAPCVERTLTGEACHAECTIAPVRAMDGDGCDDLDPCTRDVATRSEADCSLRCDHFAIHEASASDGCCPSGANRADDPDCDDETSDAEVCAMRSPWNPTCTACTCAKCTESARACLASNADERDRCAQAVSCTYTNGCSGTACYCGPSPLCTSPNGPCKVAFENAAGSSDPLVISNSSNDPRSPLGRAQALIRCTASNCAAECGRD